MAHILVINSSVLGEASVSKILVAEAVQRLLEANPGTLVTHRDLGDAPIPHLTTASVAGVRAVASTEAELAARALSDELIAELQAADIVVVGVPMYVDVVLRPGARLQAPAEHIERALFVVSGEIEIIGQTDTFGAIQFVVLKPGAEIILLAPSGAHLMLVGGEPFPEPRHVYWNFVSSSGDRIEQAKDDWRQGRFPQITGETEFIPLPPDPPGLVRAGVRAPSKPNE